MMESAMSATMTLAAAPNGTFQRVVCDQCGEAPVAPDHADYLSKRGMIRYGWTCAGCGHRFATECPAAIGPEEEQEAVKAFWPSLLVG
jgi:ribosomal protein S27E